jgi:hypothetical protein
MTFGWWFTTQVLEFNMKVALETLTGGWQPAEGVACLC